MLQRPLFTAAHKHAHRCGRSVENTDPVFRHNIPPAVHGGVVGGPFIKDDGSAVGEGGIDYGAVAGHPSHIGGAPVDRLLFKGKDPLVGGVIEHKVAPG